MARSKSAAIAVSVPQSDDEARAMIRELGEIERQITRLNTQLDDRIGKLSEDFGNRAGPLKERSKALHTGLQTYCAAHRARLTNGHKVKRHDFITGEVQWRKNPPKVSLRNVGAVLERLQAAGLTRFLRVKTEVNKEAMLADPDTAAQIEGVRIIDDAEDFIVLPAETDLKETAS